MLGHFKLLISIFLLLVNTSLSAKTQMEDEEWQKQYHHNRIASPQTALAMLEDVYSTIDPSAERIYVATRIHGFVTRRGRIYHHHTVADSKNPYEKVEFLILTSMDLDDEGKGKEALEQIKLAQMITTSLNDPDLDSLLALKLCRSNLTLSNYFISEFYCQSSIKNLEKTSSHFIDIKWAYRLLALSYQGTSNLEAALLANEKALSFSKSYDINDTTYSNISALLIQMKRLHRAKEYAIKALAIRIDRNIPQKIAQSKIQLASINLELHRYDEAEALSYSALSDLQHTKNNYTKAFTYYTLGNILYTKGLNDEGIEYLLLALNTQEKNTNSTLTVNINQSLSQIYLNYENPNKSLEYIDIAIKKSIAAQNKLELSESYLLKSQILEFAHNYKAALEAQKNHRETLNEIHIKNSREAYQALELRNTVIETESELISSLQKQKKQQQELSVSQSKRLFFQVLIIILVIVLVLILRSRHKLNTLACRDALTGANSRHYMFELIKKRLNEGNKHTALVMLDVDNFKKLNDKYGHPNGDLGLKHLYTTLEKTISPPHQIGRVGGEEFLLLLQGEDKPHCLALVEQARLALESSSFDTLDGKKLVITASFSWIYLEKNMTDIDQTVYHLG
ncbi:tetratricopeptide repeat-containing diguanylate cyclase [Aliivibrio wodanis]|uniref:tetratricopeptide repeat-containing diguanylate cyclase n=1 Tax=Aliivibrio wodanis TaxID=80852 RepID=UPI00406BE9EA